MRLFDYARWAEPLPPLLPVGRIDNPVSTSSFSGEGAGSPSCPRRRAGYSPAVNFWKHRLEWRRLSRSQGMMRVEPLLSLMSMMA
jgi:hypothetical protein